MKDVPMTVNRKNAIDLAAKLEGMQNFDDTVDAIETFLDLEPPTPPKPDESEIKVDDQTLWELINYIESSKTLHSSASRDQADFLIEKLGKLRGGKR